MATSRSSKDLMMTPVGASNVQDQALLIRVIPLGQSSRSSFRRVRQPLRLLGVRNSLILPHLRGIHGLAMYLQALA